MHWTHWMHTTRAKVSIHAMARVRRTTRTCAPRNRVATDCGSSRARAVLIPWSRTAVGRGHAKPRATAVARQVSVFLECALPEPSCVAPIDQHVNSATPGVASSSRSPRARQASCVLRVCVRRPILCAVVPRRSVWMTSRWGSVRTTGARSQSRPVHRAHGVTL